MGTAELVGHHIHDAQRSARCTRIPPIAELQNYLQGDSQILLKRSPEASKPKQRELVVNFLGAKKHGERFSLYFRVCL
jgi:hypothetical protein